MTTVLVVEKAITVTPTGPDLELTPNNVIPYIEVVVTSLALSGPTTVTVERSVDGTTWTTVRGAQGAVASGSMLVRDFECPLNVPVTYRATLTGATVGEIVEVVTLPASAAWVHAPRNPRGAVRVAIGAPGGGVDAIRGTAASATFEQAQDFVTPAGGTAPVASIGVRQVASGAPVVLDCLPADSAALRRLLMTSGEVVIRGLPDWSPLEASATVTLANLALAVVGGVTPRHRWTATATQVRPSSPRRPVPWLTAADFQALWPGATVTQLRALRPGWRVLDWMQNPEP